MHILEEHVENNSVANIDYKKAFDIIEPHKLYNILIEHGISTMFINLVKDVHDGNIQ